ncbi:fibrobacter succinogenes major paralogous domain [Candidatus Ornithobacterium hominis]|uniref:Fibrobacter succinogenes major paralogous domain n=1 Tax=Candidatus Ornithobacterium hominis TaxID=2497989 RepID=A0A383TXL8_9FLAO|nr:FISUMP domain-containing protein [Candidatus Ornithobacterium hominis]MCT7904118.1 fibrobacter succinogenes major paralogous domain-containing protein [Candidatus Ornithobacterium hominis]SZD72344.1 fibrobacter succinogenes major paralogous domain [Candidatus Ornithobacterium hominis]
MKKLLLSLAVLSAVAVTAQVGINTDTPQATLDISAKDNQEGGDLRIEGVKEGKSTQWLLIWDEEDNKLVKRTSLSEIKREILNEIRLDYIRKKYPDRAGDIINKIKQCTPENILFDKHFGDGKHDFVYCATTVNVTDYYTNYNKTWLNLNLGAAYADINSPHFNPTVNKTGEAIHTDENLYGSYYQWQRASDGHEFRNSQITTELLAQSWTKTGDAVGKFIDKGLDWVDGGEKASGSELQLWQAGGVNNPCPLGYHVPTIEEWTVLINLLERDNNRMFIQTELPNLVAGGIRSRNDGSLDDDGSAGSYWSSSSDDASYRADAFYFHSDGDNYGYVYYSGTLRYIGKNVRCIKD